MRIGHNSKRWHSVRVLTHGVVGLLCVTASVFGQTFPGTAASSDPFEVHGLLYSGSATEGFPPGDGWAQGATFRGVLDDNGQPALDAFGYPYRAYRQIDGNWGNQGDGLDMTLFAGSNKNLHLIGVNDSPWEWDAGAGGPQKNDITSAYFHTRVDPVTGDRWVFVAAETRSINGDSHIDFEFNQAGVLQTGDDEGQLIGLGLDGGRTINDFLVSVDFEQGGDDPIATIRYWDGVAFQLVSYPGAIFSATNFIDIAHGAGGSWKHYTADGAETNVLTHLQFVEAGVNLTALAIGVDPCSTDSTFMAKTRSSASWTADLKDFTIVTFPLEPPPQLEVTAPTGVCTETTFNVDVWELTGLPSASFDWSISGCGEIVGEPVGESIIVRSLTACGCEINLTATITAGECAHVKSIDVSISVGDSDAPTLSGQPEDETVECDAIPTAQTLTATDSCTASDVLLDESQLPDTCDGESTIVRTWSSTDDCGNEVTHTQIVSVVDTTAPVISGVPVDAEVSCDGIPEPATVTSADNCSTAVVELSESATPGACVGNETITRTWTAADACGNATSQSQVLMVSDADAPDMTGVPLNATYECDALPDPATVEATDNCSNVGVAFDEQISEGACSGESTVTRTWTATDECGNADTQTQTISLQDTVLPTLSGVPVDSTVECDSIPDPPVVTATDNCSEPTVELAEEVSPGEDAGKGLIHRTWTATDACGNQTSQTQTIIVIDTTAPTLVGVPPDTTVECDAIPEPPTVSATDNCATPNVTMEEEITEGDCSGQRTIVRTWKAVDDCGNETTAVQTIIVVDTTTPTLTNTPTDATVSCDDVPPPAEVGATDNCSTPTVELNEVAEPGACVGQTTITRTWTATDTCGNVSTFVQTLNVVDTAAPTINGDPNDLLAECDDIPDAATFTASDNCSSDVSVEFSEDTIPGSCEGNYEILRTWTATDDCGNAANKNQFVTIQDSTPPVISLDSDPTQFICDGAPVSFLVSTDDNCSEVTLTWQQLRWITATNRDRVTITPQPDGSARITVTGPAFITGAFSANDACGNAAEDLAVTIRATLGREACSQGYWKNHFNRWAPSGHAPSDSFVDTFGITDLSSTEIPESFNVAITLGEAITSTGGDFNQALLQGTAALLNAAHPTVDFPLTETEVKSIMQAAFAGLITFRHAVNGFNLGNAAERECGCPIA